ncbi:MAG: HAD family hydrolase [Cytophagales bacterium]
MQLTIDSKAKALIFDLDGTLVDTMPTHFIAWQNTMTKYGIDFTHDIFIKYAGIPTFKIIALLNEEFGTQLDPEMVHLEKESAFLTIINQIKPVSQVAALAKKYFGILPMSIGTGGVPDVAKLTLEAVGLEKYFTIIVTSRDVENFKPAPDTFLKCAELMGAEPQFCQVFEDAENGLKAGRAAGMITTDVRPYYD